MLDARYWMLVRHSGQYPASRDQHRCAPLYALKKQQPESIEVARYLPLVGLRRSFASKRAVKSQVLTAMP